MESPSTFKQPPADTFTPEDKSEEVLRLEEGLEPLVGPVVVGGSASADCFRYRGQLQAGRERETIGDDVLADWNTPKKSPW